MRLERQRRGEAQFRAEGGIDAVEEVGDCRRAGGYRVGDLAVAELAVGEEGASVGGAVGDRAAMRRKRKCGASTWAQMITS